jgi:hypothetical protein
MAPCSYVVLSHNAGGFLSFKPNILKGLLLDVAHTVESHFTLVIYQVFLAYIFGHTHFFILVFFILMITCLKIFSWCKIVTAFGIASLLKWTLVGETLFVMLCICTFCGSVEMLLILHSAVVRLWILWTIGHAAFNIEVFHWTQLFPATLLH